MFHQPLLRWYDKNKRELPWRLSTPNPYKIWISEVMLQQTQVETVLPYFQRFLKLFPSVKVLAQAPVEEVLRVWSGLGYYSRARNLHLAAQKIVGECKGIFPNTRERLLQLPGVGIYSAGAIASIAFDQRVPLVDGNVIRVLTRVFALPGDPKTNPLKTKLWKLAESLVPAKRSGDFNQALMELGALVCLPKEPKCFLCPVKKCCKAYRQKKVEVYPTPKEKPRREKVFLTSALIEKNGSYLLAKRNSKKHLQSMWEFPQMGPKQLGIVADWRSSLPPVRHAIMNKSIRLTPSLYRYRKGTPKTGHTYVDFTWITPQEFGNFPSSSLNSKILRCL